MVHGQKRNKFNSKDSKSPFKHAFSKELNCGTHVIKQKDPHGFGTILF
jgi:hypothetical protein